MNKEQATKKLLDVLPSGSVVRSVIDHEGKFLFIAHRDSSLAGRLDPFFSVDKSTGEVRDFSPQDYSDPLMIINKLKTNGTA